MNMKKLFLMIVAIVAFAATADAQGFLKKLKDKAVERVQNKIENKVERTVDDEMDGVLDGKTKEQSARPQRETVDDAAGEDSPTTATSSDFKRGSVILFQDDVTAETVGEFPSKWDLFQGTVETKTLGGVKAINLTDNAQVQPLIKEKGAYLPEEFTIEYDFYYWATENVPGNDGIGLNDLKLILAVTKDRSDFPGEGYDEGELTAFVLRHSICNEAEQSGSNALEQSPGNVETSQSHQSTSA